MYQDFVDFASLMISYLMNWYKEKQSGDNNVMWKSLFLYVFNDALEKYFKAKVVHDINKPDSEKLLLIEIKTYKEKIWNDLEPYHYKINQILTAPDANIGEVFATVGYIYDKLISSCHSDLVITAFMMLYSDKFKAFREYLYLYMDRSNKNAMCRQIMFDMYRNSTVPNFSLESIRNTFLAENWGSLEAYINESVE